MSIYYTRYSESVLLFKSFSSNSILKIDAFGSSLVQNDAFDHYNYYFNTFRKNIGHCLGIVGVINLATSRYVIVASGASVQTKVLANNVYKLSGCEFIPIKLESVPFTKSSSSNDDRYYVNLLKYHLTNSNLLYCQSLDLSHNFQSLFSKENEVTRTTISNLSTFNPTPMNKDLINSFDSDYFWNEYLLSELIGLSNERNSGPVCEFLIPLIYGFVEFTQVPSSNVHESRQIWFGVISRRNKYRAGTRYFKRGVDSQGNVANFNETEQIVLVKEDNKVSAFSFLQIRGSIPIHWAEINNLKYKPILSLSKNSNLNSSVLHFTSLKEKFSDLEKVYIVNLINSKGHELPIKNAFESTVSELIALRNNDQNLPAIDYIYFDFHDQCKKFNYQNTNLVTEELKNHRFSFNDYFSVEFTGQDFFKQNIVPHGIIVNVMSTQKNIVRTNCMDCLDRTNVVQSVIGKWILTEQLNKLEFNYYPNIQYKMESALSDVESSNHSMVPTFTSAFNNIWTNNGNYISKAYSGTGALKSEFTRTGKRTVDGAIRDLVNSIVRYFKNNFYDGYRQDSYDVFLGNFQPSLFNETTDYKKYDTNSTTANNFSSRMSIDKQNTNEENILTTAIDSSSKSGHKKTNSVFMGNPSRFSMSQNSNYTPFGSLTNFQSAHSLIYPSNINMSSSPFYDCRPFKYQSMPYLLVSTTALFFSVIFFPKDNSITTSSNLILLGACFVIINWSVLFILGNGLQFVVWPKLCDIGFLRKRKVIGEATDSDDDGVEGFEYVIADEFTSGMAKLD
ncbi:hypothetical protein DASC09_031930 [Saccharomycopsis crataegensis]|uniref:SAC domain-containing protein n=1 Tax=Saccharomycopsis crataegensis TaxID=43959 RepID=A0AAV5QLY1_9ASCO|nr:hypothetical protein DASC09_031930 [Saccharomycopsis crataegensis]